MQLLINGSAFPAFAFAVAQYAQAHVLTAALSIPLFFKSHEAR